MFHTSTSPEPFEIVSDGLFGGIFASVKPYYTAPCGVDAYLYIVDSPRHLSSDDLYTMRMQDGSDVDDIALDICDGDEELASAILRASCNVIEIMESRGIDDPDFAWDAQSKRGELARRLGFTSIEMRDEQGTAFLCLPGCTVRRAQDDEL